MRTEVVVDKPLAEQTPAEIDAVWFEAAGKLNSILDRLAYWREVLEKAEREYERRNAQERYDAYELETRAERAKLKELIDPRQAEWDRRGGWKRYLICQTDGGHFHKNGCHTLGRGRYPSSVAWVAQLSGLDDQEVIEQVGFRACSQPDCFPLAPVHPAWARTEAEYKRKSLEEKLAKWSKGLAMREKKVANARKRLEKGQAKLAAAAKLLALGNMGQQAEWERIEAESDIRYASDDLRWGEKEVERWLSKRPA
jgi:hypothetical protein